MHIVLQNKIGTYGVSEPFLLSCLFIYSAQANRLFSHFGGKSFVEIAQRDSRVELLQFAGEAANVCGGFAFFVSGVEGDTHYEGFYRFRQQIVFQPFENSMGGDKANGRSDDLKWVADRQANAFGAEIESQDTRHGND